MMKLGTVVRGSKKYINHVTHPMISADIGIFSPEITIFCYIKKYTYRLHFIHSLYIVSIFLTSFESLKVVLRNLVTILIMPAKLATLGLFKVKANLK